MRDLPDTAVASPQPASEWNARVELAALHRILALHGWDDHIFTHVTARVPGEPRHMLLAPLGALFQEITASCLVKTTLDGLPVDSADTGLNRGAVVIHGGVYEGAPHVNFVVHLHTVANVAVSAMRDGLLPISQPAMGLTGRVAYHDYEGLAINFEERQRLVARLGDKRVLVLRNHGSLVCATSAAEAHDYTYIYERACAIQVAALAAGSGNIIQCSEDVAGVTASQFDYDPNMAKLSWAAVLRRVRQQSPGFDT